MPACPRVLPVLLLLLLPQRRAATLLHVQYPLAMHGRGPVRLKHALHHPQCARLPVRQSQLLHSACVIKGWRAQRRQMWLRCRKVPLLMTLEGLQPLWDSFSVGAASSIPLCF